MATAAPQPAQLRIVHYPDPALRVKCKPVGAIDDRIRAIAARMIELMHEADGVGLAAPQVALDLRMFVAHPDRQDPDGARVFINPVLSNPSANTGEHEEGCLSIPGVFGQITRPLAITVEALDLDGKPFTLTSDQLAARVWQHETDHLDGVLIIDRMTPMDRQANKAALKEMEKAGSRE